MRIESKNKTNGRRREYDRTSKQGNNDDASNNIDNNKNNRRGVEKYYPGRCLFEHGRLNSVRMGDEERRVMLETVGIARKKTKK